MGPELSSGLEANSAVGQEPARRIEFSLRTRRSSPFAELCLGILGSGAPSIRRIHLRRRLELDFSRAYSFGPMIVQPMKRCSMKRKSITCAILGSLRFGKIRRRGMLGGRATEGSGKAFRPENSRRQFRKQLGARLGSSSCR